MSDYISRADAIEAVCKWGTNEERKGNLTMTMVSVKQCVADILSALPSAEAYFTDGNKIAEWIPCSERLPKEKQEVYVTVYFIEGDTGRAYGYMDGFGRWHLYSTVEGTLNSGYEVTAWMPLPKPYREDGE